jgi:hypothetical protein
MQVSCQCRAAVSAHCQCTYPCLPLMKTPLILFLLTLPAPLAALTPPGEPDNPAAKIKSAIVRDWTARSDSGGVEVSSPSYPMPYKRGCVIHSLYFPTVATGPMPGHMISQDRYFVFAIDEACANADHTQFFGIEPANDTFALLDFGKRLKDGPRPGKDRIAEADRMRISPCFAPDAMANTRIVRAHSWRHKGSGHDDRYQATLHCKAVDDAGEIVALGIRDQDVITWVFKPWGEVRADLPATPEVE